MSNTLIEHKILLELVQMAVSGKDCTLPEGVDWVRVMDVAFDQGVAGVCFDAIERLPEGRQPDSDTLMEWYGQVEYLRADYQQQSDAAARFAAELKKEGVRIWVLKGLAYARYYRQPELRYCCDFDCVLSDFEAGNRVAERMGAEVDRTQQKHSHIILDGIHIENHLTCTGVDTDGLEEYLSQMLSHYVGDKLGSSALELPPLMFDALFCLYHAKTHFVVEDGIEMRHVVDWVLIRRELVKQGLYDSCVRDAERFGLQKFLVALDGVADLVEGKKELADLSECERLMWEDIIRVRVIEEHSEGWFRTRLRVLRQMKRNDWKYRLYTDSSAWKNIYGSLKRYVIRVMKQPEVVRYMFGKGTPERNPIK